MLKIDMLPAGEGDAILLEYGEPGKTHVVMVDTGQYYATDELVPKINELTLAEKSIELMVVTHIDCDHLDGAVNMLMVDDAKLKIEEIWFNAYFHHADIPPDLMGAEHAEILSALIDKRKIPWNKTLGGNPVAIKNSDELRTKTLKGGLKLTLLSPTTKTLTNLVDEWEKEVKKHGLVPGSREQALELMKDKPQYKPPDLMGDDGPDIDKLVDKNFKQHDTPANDASIAFLAEYDGRSCLFTGDANPKVLKESISTLLKDRGEKYLELDLMKVSHHGSQGNTSPVLLEMIQCKRFLLSTNGNRHHHPHPETIARIINTNGPDVQLYFNYKSDETEVWDNEGLRMLHSYCTHYPEKKNEGITLEL